jgi:hypothetical protein
MLKKFKYPENMLDKYQIMNLIIKDEMENQDSGKDDLAGYAEMHFGPRIFNEGFERYTNEEIQEWYYREYLPDRQSDIENGYDRGQ